MPANGVAAAGLAELGDSSTDAVYVYASFARAKAQIAGLEPIDYFFARELCRDLGFDRQLFHLLLALSESLRNGHTCLPLASIAGQCFGFASDDEGLVSHHGFIFAGEEPLEQLLTGLALAPGQQKAIVYHRKSLYLRRYFAFEAELADFIRNKSAGNFDTFSSCEIKACLDELFPLDSGSEAAGEIDWQHIAVANAVNKGFSVIAGGPGTGKTYTVTKLLAALIMLTQARDGHKPLNIALVAPTGKAAQRLSESIAKAVKGFSTFIPDQVLAAIPEQALTLHRLLGVIPNQVNFRHHRDNLLEADLVLIDEVSMVDLALMTRVFRALPPRSRVILLGDADQLPSVAAGSVLSDVAPRPHPGFSAQNLKYLQQVTGCLSLPKVKAGVQEGDHITYLLKSRRFDGKGGIGRLAAAVIAGDSEPSWQLLTRAQEAGDEQLSLLPADLLSWLPRLAEQYYLPLYRCRDVEEAFSLLGRFRVLCAMRKGEYGVENINQVIRQCLAAHGAADAGGRLYHGMPVMISENDYRLGLYNGDIGMIWRNDKGHLMAVFEDAGTDFKWLMPSRLPQYETVYAMTIHKTQGSEFDHVAMLLPGQTDNKLLSRELLYTGITRAKSRLSIASKANVWCHGVEARVKRFSGLIPKLRDQG
ncbi:exodeoxyribonuclease V subunit alpha [Thalassomonas viridans]|uniref:RecBCD enzyme subunit RecD n=1 Tax=Thalassomonas viridans TaxID=137584 RepID=A0AAF0C9Q0_9GAMM|nr:exodeoxyribonuclease V subunit alpha [Thalassomonas viridans]WDE07752.1 exodeoxyribonuclease V subunit alpha [Thalassomonas viridans]